MDDMEEGELPDSPVDGERIQIQGDAIDAPYTPLPRPESMKSLSSTMTRPRSATNSSTVANMGDVGDIEDVGACDDIYVSGFSGVANRDSDDDVTPADRIIRGLAGSSSDEETDSETECGGRPQRKLPRSLKEHPKQNLAGNDGGLLFRAMATQFQNDRISKKKSNNVWGAVLTEESLTSDLTGIGVGKRGANELGSDRGAETYDYFLAQEAEDEKKKIDQNSSQERRRASLDEELEKYWNRGGSSKLISDEMEQADIDQRRKEAIQAGKKRNVKERLGRRQDIPNDDSSHLDNMSIPQPGVSRNISDISESVLEMLQEERMQAAIAVAAKGDEVMVNDTDDEGEIADGDFDKAELLGEELAAKLSEPKTELMTGVVQIIGPEIALELFHKTQEVERNGGMMIKNGARRRTPGGVYLHLLRELKDPRVDQKEVRRFFNRQQTPKYQSKSTFDKRRMRQKSADTFESELKMFQKLSKKNKKTSKEDHEEDLKPLPDILTLATGRLPAKDRADTVTEDLPDVPPNSVEPPERTLSVYEDDFLSAETEDIELF